MFVDLNADAGESPADRRLFGLVSSVNLACGAHAGDRELILGALMLARQHDLTVGAHPGYPDRAGFGRLELGLTPASIQELVAEQLTYLQGLADSEGVTLGHVKPHGALYNRMARDLEAATAVAAAVTEVEPDLRLFVPAGPSFTGLSELLAPMGVACVAEAFPDRAYLDDGSLMPRNQAGAVISRPGAVARRALELALGQGVLTAGGQRLQLGADTLCLHGDNPAALQVAKAVHRTLLDAGFSLRGVS